MSRATSKKWDFQLNLANSGNHILHGDGFRISYVAQTGGVMVSAPSAGGRALSVLPPHHIVIARSSQMVSDLTAAFDRVKQRYGANYPSFLSFITGPSRTGDIERILVLGAHGPKRLTVLLLGE